MSSSHLSRSRLAWVGAAVVVLLGVAFVVRGLGAEPISVAAPQAVPVQVALVQQMDVPLWVSAIGTVQPLNSVNLRVRADGELTDVLFDEGQMVRKGSLLAKIDPRPYQAQLAQAEALVARDRAQLANLQANLNRASKLAAAKAGPTQDVDTYKAQLAAQQASLRADQAALDNARLQLSFTEIRAPFSGRTGQRLLDAGSIVRGSEASGLVTLTQMNPISVAFMVSQDQLPQILREQAKAPLQVLAMSRDGREEIARGTLTFIDSRVASASGQVQLKARFDNDKQQLWPGALVGARLLLATEQAVTTVPENAVQLGRDGYYVYVVNGQQQVELRPVQASDVVVDGRQWIQAGLAAGETVITVGQSRVAPGVSVAPVEAEANSAVASAEGQR